MCYAIHLCLVIILKVLTFNETEVALFHFFCALWPFNKNAIF